MAVYFVSYDLNKVGQDYKNLYIALNSYPNHRHDLDSTWFISTGDSAKQIYDKLSPHIDSNDKIIVIEVKGHWHAKLSREAYDWLKANIT